MMRLLCYEPEVPNFGDDLNKVLWPALAPDLFARRADGNVQDEAFVGIGTIVGIDPGPSRILNVFSSGAGYTNVDGWKGRDVRYHCVRGPVTARLLGLEPDRALTDGAVLAPMLDRFRDGAKSGRVVVVPHYETLAFAGWPEAVRMAGFDLLDPRNEPDVVIAGLAGASLVLTESLHGAILADAFGVPWRSFAVSRNFSTAKWADWSASLDLRVEVALIPPPDPVTLFRFGKRPEPFGSGLVLDPETALREFRQRVTGTPPVSRLKAGAKAVLEALPLARRLLGFSPERTARALHDLSEQEPFLSRESKRAILRETMLHRLQALAKAHGAAPVPV